MYALVEFAGKQIKVEEGTQVKVPLVSEKVGAKVIFDKILYFDDDKNKLVGTPYIDGMTIDAKVAEHDRDKKIIVFKFKRRKGYQRKNGHRQQYSVLEVGKLSAKKKGAAKKTVKAVTAKKSEKKTNVKAAVKKTTSKSKTTTKKD
jgi:large subunit ribosomal protein L21